MSWSLYANAKSPDAMREYVKRQPTNDAEHPYALPPEARDLILAAIDLAAITREGVGVKLESAGHRPDGSCYVKIEPLVLVQ